MSQLKETTWVWTIVQDPEGNEQFLGQHDELSNISFIPFFREKEEAERCLSGLVKNPGHKYEIQAILFEELKLFCAGGKVMLFLLNSSGKILEKFHPESTT